jgi:hypothetical protein
LVSLSLAAAARTLADPASGRSDQQVLDDLAAADRVLFDPADPDEPALHAAARPLIHLQQLMHELVTSDYSTDTIPDLVLAAPAARVLVLPSGPGSWASPGAP